MIDTLYTKCLIKSKSLKGLRHDFSSKIIDLHFTLFFVHKSGLKIGILNYQKDDCTQRRILGPIRLLLFSLSLSVSPYCHFFFGFKTKYITL